MVSLLETVAVSETSLSQKLYPLVGACVNGLIERESDISPEEAKKVLLRLSKIIPDVICNVEQFEYELVQFSKLRKGNGFVFSSLAHKFLNTRSISRDFRISGSNANSRIKSRPDGGDDSEMATNDSVAAGRDMDVDSAVSSDEEDGDDEADEERGFTLNRENVDDSSSDDDDSTGEDENPNSDEENESTQPHKKLRQY